MTIATRRGSDRTAELSSVNGALPKRKANEVTSTNDVDTTAAKRQKTVPDQSTPRKPAKTHRAAKAPRRPRKHQATAAASDMANTVAPAPALVAACASASSSNPNTTAPAPAAVVAPSPSADSNAPAAVQNQALQPAAASTESARKVKAPNKPLPPPAYRPDACFTHAFPPPVTPWNQSFPAPTPRLTHALSTCPIDWTKLSDLGDREIEAYELRAPWNTHEVPFQDVAQQSAFPGNGGKQPSVECIRKRFKNANTAVFALTGVYFPESSQGLEAWDIKKPTDPKKERKTSRSTRQATTHQLTPIHVDDRREHAVYTGDVVAVQLKSPSDSRSSVRICDASLIPAYEDLITYKERLDENDQPYIEAFAPFLPFSAKAFDHWHSAVCLGNDQGFLKQTLVCKQIGDDQYMLRVNSKPHNASADLMLETYVVSQAMGTEQTSSMILRELEKKLNNPLTPTMDDDNLQCMLYLHSGDPLREVVNGFQWRTAGLSPSSAHSNQGDDDKLL